MQLAQTIETLSNTVEEDWMPAPGMRIISENEIDENALKQIWARQALSGWSLDGRDIPFDKAGFAEAIAFTQDGFAEGSIIVSNDGFNPLAIVSSTNSIPITIFWLWERDQIRAYWSVSKADTVYILDSQSNYASYPVVFI